MAWAAGSLDRWITGGDKGLEVILLLSPLLFFTEYFSVSLSVNGNLTATFLTIKSILSGMKERTSGNIITISSSAGRTPHPQAPIAPGELHCVGKELKATAGRNDVDRHIAETG